ncbi:hypothetical protein ACFLXL_02325, partial [Chloroflexota bacterium]
MDIGNNKYDKGEFTSKQPVSDEDKFAIAAYYRAEYKKGRSNEDILDELAEKYHRSTRQIQRYISG